MNLKEVTKMTLTQDKVSAKGTGNGRIMTLVGLAGLVCLSLLLLAVPAGATEIGWGIQIWSNPPYAYVNVAPMNGGMSWGGWTDSTTGSASFTTLPAYTWYTVTISKPGYQTYTQNVYVDLQNTKEVDATLIPW
jgi:hypothetical protein